MTSALGEVIRVFRALSTTRIRSSRDLSFAWQRNYYEHIIRTEEEFGAISEYIALNPANWANDRENRAVVQGAASKVLWQV
jgi:hypothetical protein